MKNEELKEKKAGQKKKATVEKNQDKMKADGMKEKNSKVDYNQEVLSKEEVDEKLSETQGVSKKMGQKKKSTSDLILVLALVVVVVLGFVVMNGGKEEPSYELPLTLSGEAGLHELTYQEYQEKIDSGEAFVVILERATCSHCIEYMPDVEDFADENNLPMYYVDTDTFSEEDWMGFEKSNTFLKKNSNSWGTPTTIVLAGSEAVDYIEGYDSTNKDAHFQSLLEMYQNYFDMDNE